MNNTIKNHEPFYFDHLDDATTWVKHTLGNDKFINKYDNMFESICEFICEIGVSYEHIINPDMLWNSLEESSEILDKENIEDYGYSSIDEYLKDNDDYLIVDPDRMWIILTW